LIVDSADLKRHSFPDTTPLNRTHNCGWSFNGLSINCSDDIVHLQPCLVSWTHLLN
jgi:hypothetical protein